jgi:hypothetical protein
MKSLSSTFLRNAIAAVVAGALAGCSSQPAPIATAASTASQLSEEQALASLHSGTVALDCGAPCSEAWNRNRPELSRLFRAGDWQGLAVLTMRTNYRQDLAYYYLGRSAEGLGGGAAALGYYRTALSLTTAAGADGKCAAIPGGCDGVNLLPDETLHIQIAQALVPRHAPAAPHAARSQPSADQGPASPAPAGTWIDPPPANP